MAAIKEKFEMIEDDTKRREDNTKRREDETRRKKVEEFEADVLEVIKKHEGNLKARDLFMAFTAVSTGMLNANISHLMKAGKPADEIREMYTAVIEKLVADARMKRLSSDKKSETDKRDS